ncbi:MAG: hypothetical protein EON54_17960 [Alcaligenaceae bacterium]|nr:MAG: hypothetical protein EON54_17960 [Alcaligenaceae bacterium]
MKLLRLAIMMGALSGVSVAAYAQPYKYEGVKPSAQNGVAPGYQPLSTPRAVTPGQGPLNPARTGVESSRGNAGGGIGPRSSSSAGGGLRMPSVGESRSNSSFGAGMPTAPGSRPGYGQ